MKETNLVSFPTKLKKEANPSKSQEKAFSMNTFDQIDSRFIVKSAEEFAKSILFGNLYEELRPKGKRVRSKLSQI